MTTTLTVRDLVDAIAQLGTAQAYTYVSGNGYVQITSIEFPEGPIRFRRDGKIGVGRVSTVQLATMASICSSRPNYPLHIDRIFSAGGNSRSVLETLLALTPHFFICWPRRVNSFTGEIKQNLKHIMYCPDEQHSLGQIAEHEYDEIITELELGLDFGNISGITPTALGSEFDSIEAKRTHTQMQIALIEIGNALGFRTWIARNDQSVLINGVRLGEFPGVLSGLRDMPILYNDAIRTAAELIDCIWFTQDGNRIPAVIEIEHSTGVTSGLTRMSKLHETMPSINTTFTVVASNLLRNKVVSEGNHIHFRELNTAYMSYSTVRELYGLVKRYRLAGVVDYKFIEPFLERVVSN